jgi:hypothetical protein
MDCQLSLQSPTERLGGLPHLFVPDVGVPHGGADILVAEEFLNFPQILSHVIKEDRCGAMAEPVRRDLPHRDRARR